MRSCVSGTERERCILHGGAQGVAPVGLLWENESEPPLDKRNSNISPIEEEEKMLKGGICRIKKK